MERSRNRPSRVRAVLAAAWRPMAVGAAGAALVIGALALSRSGLFHVRHIEVEGNGRLTRAEIVGLSEITQEANAIWLDEAAAEDRIEENGWVRSADVSVQLPWTVRVTVEERIPVAVVTRGVNRMLVAGDGTVLGVAGRTEGLPVIEAPPPRIGATDTSSFGAAARALTELPPRLRSGVKRVLVSPGATMELVLDDGLRVMLGTSRDVGPKVEALRAVLAWASGAGEELRRIDVSAPSAPAVVLAG